MSHVAVQEILEELEVDTRLPKALLLLKKELELAKLQSKISQQAPLSTAPPSCCNMQPAPGCSSYSRELRSATDALRCRCKTRYRRRKSGIC